MAQGIKSRKKLNSKTRTNQGKKNAPKRLDIFDSILQKGIQQKAEITRGAVYGAIANIKVSKNFRKIVFILDRIITENDIGEVFYAPCDVYLER